MDNAVMTCDGYGEVIVFPRHFKNLPNPRQKGKAVYPLEEILLPCLLAVLAGADTFTGIGLRNLRSGNLCHEVVAASVFQLT